MSSLFTNLASDTPARIRLLAKFVENTYEKADKLIEIRDAAQGRLKAVEKEIEAEKKELLAEGEEVDGEMEDLWYLRRLEGGLFTLQTVDYILAWIAMEDDGVSVTYIVISTWLTKCCRFAHTCSKCCNGGTNR